MTRTTRTLTAAVLAGAAAAYALLLRPRQLHWGATDEECDQLLPGDAILPEADLVTTRAITVHAPPSRVWPWVAQLGQARGGFYTYERLERLFGTHIHNADRVVPEWQDVKVGDQLQLTPDASLEVAVADPPRALVASSGPRTGPPAGPVDFTWAFVLREGEHGTTRLLVRERYRYTRPWAALLTEPVELVSFVMTERMLRGIRDRVEHLG
jgi:hypothetical protein